MALFTQGQKIEVVVRKEDLSAATAGANDTSTEGASSNTANEASGNGTPSTAQSSKVNKRIMVTKVLSAGIAAGRLLLNYYASGVNYRTGDSAQQEAVQRSFELVEEAGGLIASAGIGALYGIRGGPVGMIVGSVLALATTATSLGVKYANKEREYNLKVFKENNAIQYKRARANLSLTTGRLR